MIRKDKTDSLFLGRFRLADFHFVMTMDLDEMPFVHRTKEIEEVMQFGIPLSEVFSRKMSRKRLKLTSDEIVKQAVVAGLGNSLIPLIGIKNELQNGELHIIPSRSLPIITHWRLMRHREKKLSPVAMAYLEFIRDNKQLIIERNFKWYTDFRIL